MKTSEQADELEHHEIRIMERTAMKGLVEYTSEQFTNVTNYHCILHTPALHFATTPSDSSQLSCFLFLFLRKSMC